jgi:hypothetical protein
MLVRDNFPLALKIIFKQLPLMLRILHTNMRYVWFMFQRAGFMILALLIPLLILFFYSRGSISHVENPLSNSKAGQSAILQLIVKSVQNIGFLILSYFFARLVAWFQLTEPGTLDKFASVRAKNENFRIMTMGHTHNPGTYTFNGKTKFFNTGTWIPVIEISNADYRPDRTYTFLHLQRNADGKLEPAAEGMLQRWNDDAGRDDLQLLIERK